MWILETTAVIMAWAVGMAFGFCLLSFIFELIVENINSIKDTFRDS